MIIATDMWGSYFIRCLRTAKHDSTIFVVEFAVVRSSEEIVVVIFREKFPFELLARCTRLHKTLCSGSLVHKTSLRYRTLLCDRMGISAIHRELGLKRALFYIRRRQLM